MTDKCCPVDSELCPNPLLLCLNPSCCTVQADLEFVVSLPDAGLWACCAMPYCFPAYSKCKRNCVFINVSLLTSQVVIISFCFLPETTSKTCELPCF